MLGVVKRMYRMYIEAFTGDDVLSRVCFIIQRLKGGGGGIGNGWNTDAQQLVGYMIFSTLCVEYVWTFTRSSLKTHHKVLF